MFSIQVSSEKQYSEYSEMFISFSINPEEHWDAMKEIFT